MRRCLWMCLLALAVAVMANAADEQAAKTSVGPEANRLPFVDEWVASGLSAFGKALAGLATVKPETLTSTPDFGGATVRYATFRFRGPNGTTLPCVMAVAETAKGDKALYVDCDCDGKLTAQERAAVADEGQRPPDFGAAGELVWLAQTSKPYARQLAVRLSPFGGTINCAVRGLWRGKLPIDGKPRDVILVDANANMVLETSRDRAYVDLNSDGKFDPTNERFPLMGRMEFGESGFSFADTMEPDKVAWVAAPMGKVPAIFGIAKLGGKPDRFSATLSRKGGGVFQVTALDKAVEVPAGTYVVDSLYLRMTGADGVGHEYTFDGRDASKVIELQGTEVANVELMGDTALSINALGEAKPGDTLTVQDSVKTATGLVLATHTSGGRQVPPHAVLKLPGQEEPVATGVTNYG